ncbi:hypothetical protein [Hyphococcus sp.]|uniref:hypothetical protein n=1 Tax=Hyphococcus sp. TaxID=2038636 RepID=UPI002084D720|nr:MAG: hypothetical protein DHS20C04_30710 [Marinicaulis sp.]
MAVTGQDVLKFQNSAIGVFSHQEAATFSFVAATKKVTRPSGDFTTNYEVDQFFTAEDTVLNKKKCFRILAVSALQLTLDVAPVEEASVACTLRVFDLAGLSTQSSGPNVSSPEIDVTHSLSERTETLPGLRTNSQLSFQSFKRRNDAGLNALKVLQEGGTQSYFLKAYGDREGFERYFGNVAEIGEEASVNGVYSVPVSISISNNVIDSELL